MRSCAFRGAMIDHLRRHATLCRSGMAKRKELTAVRARLEQRLGRVPLEAEMSAEMGLSPADYRELADAAEFVQEHSMDEVYSDQSMWFADVEERADDVLERESLKKALAACVGKPAGARGDGASALLRRGNEPRGNRRDAGHRRGARLPDQEGSTGQAARAC
jgi:hypothetical protein